MKNYLLLLIVCLCVMSCKENKEKIIKPNDSLHVGVVYAGFPRDGDTTEIRASYKKLNEDSVNYYLVGFLAMDDGKSTYGNCTMSTTNVDIEIDSVSDFVYKKHSHKWAVKSKKRLIILSLCKITKYQYDNF